MPRRTFRWNSSYFLNLPGNNQIMLDSLRYMYLRKYVGHYNLQPILRNHGLLVKYLHDIHRARAIAFVNQHFKNYFVVGIL